MKMSLRSKRILIIAGGFVIVGLIVLSLANLTRNDNKGDGSSTVYKDPVSGQTITQQKNKAPEQGAPDDTGEATNQPTFAGFNVLLDKGYTLAELNATEKALVAYKPISDPSGLISLDVSNVQPGFPEENDPEERFFVTSKIVFRLNEQNTDYQMKLYHTGTGEIQLILKNADGTNQLYDSGKVTSTVAQ